MYHLTMYNVLFIWSFIVMYNWSLFGNGRLRRMNTDYSQKLRTFVRRLCDSHKSNMLDNKEEFCFDAVALNIRTMNNYRLTTLTR